MRGKTFEVLDRLAAGIRDKVTRSVFILPPEHQEGDFKRGVRKRLAVIVCIEKGVLKCDISSSKDSRAVKRQENQLLFGQLRITAGGEDNSRRGFGICFQHEV